MIATIRPDDWNLALLVHVLGAMLLVGTLILAAAALFVAWRDGNAASLRLAYRTLLIGVLPSWIVMRVSAQWIASKEGLEDSEVAWIGIGFMAAEPGFVLIVIVDGSGRARDAARQPQRGSGRHRPHRGGARLAADRRLRLRDVGDGGEAALGLPARPVRGARRYQCTPRMRFANSTA